MRQPISAGTRWSSIPSRIAFMSPTSDRLPSTMRCPSLQVNCPLVASCRNFRPLVPADADFALGLQRLGKIVVRLHPQPGLRGAAESFGEANRHFRADAGALIDEIIQRLPGNAKGLRARGYAQSERLKALLPHDAARVRWGLHGHRPVPVIMIIDNLKLEPTYSGAATARPIQSRTNWQLRFAHAPERRHA